MPHIPKLFERKHPLSIFVKEPALPTPEREDHTPLLIMFLERNLEEMTKVRKSIETLPHDGHAGGG